MSTTKLSTLFAAAALAGGARVASAQPQAVHDQPIMHSHHHAQSSPAATSDFQKTIMPNEQGLRRTSIEEESPLDNKVELCRRHLATVEASAAAETDEAMGDGRTLSLLGGALRGKPSAAASNTATASRKPIQIDRRMLSEYGRQLEEANIGRVDGSGMDEKRKLNAQRSLFEVLYDFPECRCLEVEDCMSFIQKEHYNNDVPQFEARLVRNYDQANYNVVAIRPCDDGIHVCGADGDGIVTYPFAWIVDGIGYSIGPWDCKTTGMHLTTEQCCDFIKSSVPLQDDRGRFLKCHITPESRLHPEADPNTIIIPFDPKTHSVAGVPYTN